MQLKSLAFLAFSVKCNVVSLKNENELTEGGLCAVFPVKLRTTKRNHIIKLESLFLGGINK